MARFIYKAKKGPTEIVQGELEAENEDAALGKITALGLVPIKLDSTAKAEPAPRVKAAPSEKAAVTIKEADRERLRVSHRDMNVFTRQFAILLKASVPLLRIFEILQTQ